MDRFISEDDLRTFEGFLKYQAVDPAVLTPDELTTWRGYFEEATRLRETSPKVGVMKLRPALGEQKYGVALRDEAALWLTMWVRCSRKGEVFVMYPRAAGGNPHASYHLDGTYHHKSYGSAGIRQTKQPLNIAFKDSEHLGLYMGHGKNTGAVCDPAAFDRVVVTGTRSARGQAGEEVRRSVPQSPAILGDFPTRPLSQIFEPAPAKNAIMNAVS